MRINHSLVSKIFLAIAIVILIGTAYFISRDYQDIWVLEGLEIPFVLFVLTFAAAFFLEKRISCRVTIAVIGRAVFTLIPAVKYTWFLGPFIDQNMQFSLAKTVYTTGHIATYSASYISTPLQHLSYSISAIAGYSETPLQHLSYSMFSSVLGITIVDSMKFLPVFWAMLYPLLIYIIIKNMHFPEDSTLIGYALLISSIPVSMVTQYVATGSLFGALLVELVLTLIVLTVLKKNLLFLPILFFSALALASAHSLSSIILAGCLLIVLFLTRLSRLGLSSSLTVSKVLAVASIGFAWLMFQAVTNFRAIITIFLVNVPTGSTPVTEYVSASFFSVLRINPIAAARSFIAWLGADAFFLILTLFGLFVMLRTRKRLNQVAKFLTIFCSIVFFLIAIGVFIKAGGTRLMIFAEFLFPIFSAIFLFRIGKKTRFRRIIVGLVFFLMIFLATIQFYGYQPLIPSANVLYPKLPQNVPTSLVGMVNTIYQRQMIAFAGKYVSGKVATVIPTDAQILGLINESYAFLHVYTYNPMDESQPKQQYDYFLINMPGQSGVTASEPIFRDPNLIANYISNGTLVYSNGESYIMKSPPSLPP